MKKLIILLCASLVLPGCVTNNAKVRPIKEKAPKAEVDHGQLEKRDGLICFEETPFTGVGVRKYENGQNAEAHTYKDGRKHGLETSWYENGKKRWDRNFKEGKPHGLSTVWHKNGKKGVEGYFKDGKEDGQMNAWHDNGKKAMQATFKDGKMISEKKWDKEGKLVEPKP